MRLRSLEFKDCDLIYEWMKDDSINCFFKFDPNQISHNSISEFIINSKIDPNSLHYAVVNDEDEYQGTVSIKDIDPICKKGEYAIALRKSAQRQGIGSFATKEILKIAFEEEQLERIYLNVLSENDGGISLYRKIGFSFEGEFFHHLKIRGEYKSLKWFRMMKSEYDVKKKLF